MKRLKSLLFLFIGTFFFSTYISHAQRVDMATEVGFMSKSLSPKLEAEGSPYVNEEYLPVKVNGQDIIYSARYNAYNDEMEIKTAESENPIALDTKIDYTVTFINNNKVYRTLSYPNSRGQMLKGFLVKVYSTENYTLFMKENIKYQDKIKAKSSYQSDKPAKFVRDADVFYVQKNDGPVKIVPNKRKEIHEIFDTNQDKIKDFIKDSKTDSDDKNDLVKLLIFADTL
ncbi:MAG: hypothetical protein R3213_02325 [Flavobacteriaceae bacterium]|nr:hypothetical protein [Flavobacteriaceae bacterium]